MIVLSISLRVKSAKHQRKKTKHRKPAVLIFSFPVVVASLGTETELTPEAAPLLVVDTELAAAAVTTALASSVVVAVLNTSAAIGE